jgi:hypothetical protein
MDSLESLEPEILPSSSHPICLRSADAEHNTVYHDRIRTYNGGGNSAYSCYVSRESFQD